MFFKKKKQKNHKEENEPKKIELKKQSSKLDKVSEDAIAKAIKKMLHDK